MRAGEEFTRNVKVALRLTAILDRAAWTLQFTLDAFKNLDGTLSKSLDKVCVFDFVRIRINLYNVAPERPYLVVLYVELVAINILSKY